MNSTHYSKIAKSSFVLTAALTSLGLGAGVASSIENYVSPQAATSAEKEAQIAYKSKDYTTAIKLGELALQGAPRNADYRMLLGQANLAAGRFASAETLFNDVLTLSPGNGQAALNLALTQVALDHASDARATLESHRDLIAPSDYGLAVALAGDANTGVHVLESAAHASDATAKTRQNLALAYALAGQWEQSRTVASQDLTADLVDQRMTDWAQMVHPKASWEQVAALLHVTPVNDPGLPYQLALQQQSPNAPALAAAEPAAQPVAQAADAMSPRYETTSGVAPASPTIVATPVVASAPLIRADAHPARKFIAEPTRKAQVAATPIRAHMQTAAFVHHAFHRGHFAVQLGAYASVSQAHAAWNKNAHKVALLRQFSPAQSQFKAHNASFYRLSVTGFATHADADKVCAKLRASGSGCFVRTVMGDQLAAWLHGDDHAHLAAKSVPHVAKATPPAKPVTQAKAQPKQAAGNKLASR